MVPKGEIENKEFDMSKKTHEIDDLLKVVSGRLVFGYEVSNKLIPTLREVNEEYKRITQAVWLGIDGAAILAVFSLLVGTTLSIYLRTTGVPDYIAFISMVALFAPAYVYLMHFARNRYAKEMGITETCASVLCEFRQSVKELNPLEAKLDTYTSDSVWGTLLLLAVRVLEAKAEFISACKLENPSISQIKTIIEWEQHYRARFNSLFDATDKFGLGFTKDRLYRSAQEKIDENIAWRK